MRDIRDKARQLVPSPERTAAKLAELFLSTSPDLYKPQGYRKMMSALLKWQRPNGLWGQLLNDPESYDETSATAMFAYAFAEGAKAGVLNGEYKAAVEKAYAALVARLDEYGNSWTLGGYAVSIRSDLRSTASLPSAVLPEMREQIGFCE